jgi:O-acetyl-ADP-ribose deacetylase (regulator of RNase III)
MIVTTQVEDILTSPAQTLILPCNTVGALGAGLAKKFKEKWPEIEWPYKYQCQTFQLESNGLYCYRLKTKLPKQILFFPTKKHWKHPSKLHYIEKGLLKLVKDYERYGITSLAVPMLGCGLGQLEWEDVYPMILEHLDPLPIPVRICLSPEKQW